MAQISAVVATEKTALEAELAATPAPSNYRKAMINKTIDILNRMAKITGETDADYALRIDMTAQQAPAGVFSTSFWSQLEASVASEIGNNIGGGLGRSKV